MKPNEQRDIIRKENLERKIVTNETIKTLQDRLRGSKEIQKRNLDDQEVQMYQAGRQTELKHCIRLLLTPIERLKYAKSKNPEKFLLNKK